MVSRFLPFAIKTCAATFVFSAALAMSPAAHAQILTQFTFGTTPNATSTGPGYSPTTTSANVAVSNLTITVGSVSTQTINNPGNAYPSQVLLFAAGANATTPADAVSGNRSFDFTVTPNAGFQTSFSSFTFDVSLGGTGSRGYVLRSSADGFAANISSAVITTARPTFTAVSIPLTAGVFQGITVPTTFRVYTFAPFAGATVDYDNVTVNGTAALVTVVPEASTMVLLGLAGALGAVRIVRRKK